MIKVGVLDLQGSVAEHMKILEKIENVEPVRVKYKEDLDDIQGIILPGGESTTLGKLLKDIMPGDLLKFGLIPEFIGRLPIVVTLDKLDREALIKILTEPKNALVKQYKKLFELDDVELEFNQEALKGIADEAINRNTGARGLRAIIEDMMREIMFDIPSQENISKVIVNEDCIKTRKPELIEAEGGKRLPIKPKKGKKRKDSETA